MTIERTLILLLLVYGVVEIYGDLLAYVPLDNIDAQRRTRVYTSTCTYGSNGTVGIVSGATLATGMFGGAINMSSPDHRIELGSGSIVPAGSGAFTMLAWVKSVGPLPTTEARVINKGFTTNPSWALGYGPRFGSGGNTGNTAGRLDLSNRGSTNGYFDNPDMTGPAGSNWNLLVFTFDGNYFRFYSNGNSRGSRVASNFFPDSTSEDPTDEFVIGNYRDDANSAWTKALNGLIDEVMIFDEVLSTNAMNRYLTSTYNLPVANATVPRTAVPAVPVNISVAFTGTPTWTVLSQPAGPPVNFTSIDPTLTQVTFPTIGNYTLQFSSTNGQICNSNVFQVEVNTLQVSNTDSELSGSNADNIKSGGSNVGAIVGGVLGAIALCALIVFLVIFFVIRRKRRQPFSAVESPETSEISFKVMPTEALKKPNFEPYIYGELLKEKEGATNSDLEDLLLEPEGLRIVDIMATSMPAHEIDKMAKSLVIVFEFNEKTVPLILNAIDQEIAKTKETVQLFRPNSLPAKMFMMYAKMIGMEWLWEVLAQHINELNNNNPNSNGASLRSTGSQLYQPSGTERMTHEDEEMINKLSLWNTAQKILTDLLKSKDTLPEPLKKILQHVGIHVANKYSGGATRSMGILFFMRYVCVAIQSPHAYGILQKVPSPTVQSELNLLSKIFQNLSNGIAPPEQQQFLVTNQPKVTGFLNEIMKESIPEVDSIFVPRNALMQSRYNVSEIISAHSAKITGELKKDPENRELVEKFGAVLV